MSRDAIVEDPSIMQVTRLHRCVVVCCGVTVCCGVIAVLQCVVCLHKCVVMFYSAEVCFGVAVCGGVAVVLLWCCSVLRVKRRVHFQTTPL